MNPQELKALVDWYCDKRAIDRPKYPTDLDNLCRRMKGVGVLHEAEIGIIKENYFKSEDGK
jgi:hypothetical protein